MKKQYFEIRTKKGKPDDLVFDNVDVHLERMTDGTWWLGIYKKGTVKRLSFDIYSQSKIHLIIKEQDLPVKWIEEDKDSQVLIKE